MGKLRYLHRYMISVVALSYLNEKVIKTVAKGRMSETWGLCVVVWNDNPCTIICSTAELRDHITPLLKKSSSPILREFRLTPTHYPNKWTFMSERQIPRGDIDVLEGMAKIGFIPKTSVVYPNEEKHYFQWPGGID